MNLCPPSLIKTVRNGFATEADFVCRPVAAVSVPKKKRKMKDLNKKEAVGDLLDAFKEVCAVMHVFINVEALTACLKEGVCSKMPLCFYVNGKLGASFVVHKTFLDLHSQTRLRHSATQLKKLGTSKMQ